MNSFNDDTYEDFAIDVCLCQFWKGRNRQWAEIAGRLDAATLGWWCPVHGTVTDGEIPSSDVPTVAPEMEPVIGQLVMAL